MTMIFRVRMWSEIDAAAFEVGEIGAVSPSISVGCWLSWMMGWAMKSRCCDFLGELFAIFVAAWPRSMP
jgi:hypothetical protein